jgi:hypothetical protein
MEHSGIAVRCYAWFGATDSGNWRMQYIWQSPARMTNLAEGR